MKATLGTLPPASDDERWAYEVKFDGYRTLAFVDGGALRLQSSNRLDVTAKYPELAGFPDAVNAATAILDGELVVLDDQGRPRFELIQRHEIEVHFYVFDVLSLDGTDTVDLPYERRRELVADAVETGSNWTVPTHRIGGGADLLAATAAHQLEGVMAKRLGSIYQPGKRSPAWRKVKNRVRMEVEIGGFTAGTGSRSTTFGAILVGRRADDGRLRFAGGVGSGFDNATLVDLHRRMLALRVDTAAFDPEPPREYRRSATWIAPELSATIEMTELTNEGLVRQASFIELVAG